MTKADYEEKLGRVRRHLTDEFITPEQYKVEAHILLSKYLDRVDKDGRSLIGKAEFGCYCGIAFSQWPMKKAEYEWKLKALINQHNNDKYITREQCAVEATILLAKHFGRVDKNGHSLIGKVEDGGDGGDDGARRLPMNKEEHDEKMALLRLHLGNKFITPEQCKVEAHILLSKYLGRVDKKGRSLVGKVEDGGDDGGDEDERKRKHVKVEKDKV